MTTVIEAVRFRLSDGMDRAAFLASVPATHAFLRGCPGFRGRHLSVGDDGEWLDHVEWADAESAEGAARAFMAEPALRPFMDAMAPETVVMRHHRAVG